MLTKLGLDPAKLKPGENRLPCPECARGKGDTALSVSLKSNGTVVWFCHRCYLTGANGQYVPAARPLMSHQAAPERIEKSRGLSDYGRELYSHGGLITGIARDYLDARSCVIPPPDGDLRFIEELKHPSGYIGPALVALITDAETKAPLSLHRTWIKPDGRKADVNPPRLLLKGHPVAGGVIRLWPDDSVTSGLGIAEGIETALSLAHGYTPVWACIDAGHMEKFPILKCIDELVIAADNDPAGQKAADMCAQRWVSHSTVRIVIAGIKGADLNDEVLTWAK
jgi:putative DNA primase/helicase